MKYLLPVIILFLNTNLIYTQTSNGSVELKYLFTLVNGENQTKKEYLYRNPAEALTDQNNNIYVIEYHGTNIKKYSKEGKYLATIGRDGSGPGEFNGISSLDVYKDKITVRGTASDLAEYSVNGKLLRTLTFNVAKCNFRQLWNYPDNKYLIKYFKDYNSVDNIFYIYDRKLEKQITSFCHASIMFDTTSPIYDYERAEMNVLILSNGDVVAAKKYYDGNLYRFNSGNNWKHEIYTGNNKYRKYRVLSPYNPKTDNYNNMRGVSEHNSNGFIYFLVRDISVGLFQYENKYILNFIVKCEQDNRKTEFGVEVYTLTGQYLGYYKIEGKNINLINMTTKVYSIDRENCILVSDKVSGNTSQIKKFKLNVSIK